MFRSLLKTFRKRRHSVPEGFVSADEIRETLSRERMRIDRRGGAVCLLTFEISEQQDARECLERLAGVMQLRLRNTDLAGLLDARKIGVVLPDTKRFGAEKLAADIRDAAGYRTAELTHSISEYDRTDEDSSLPSARATRVATNGKHADTAALQQPAEAVFCSPIPLWKRAMDVCGATFGLVLISPVLLVTALMVKLTSRGPIFFVQQREGRGGRVFPMFKFRTMRVGADREQDALRQFSEQDGPAFKMKNDPRLTSIGSFLRRTSFDELPQL